MEIFNDHGQRLFRFDVHVAGDHANLVRNVAAGCHTLYIVERKALYCCKRVKRSDSPLKRFGKIVVDFV